MRLYKSKRTTILWTWPSEKMKWFFWAYRGTFFDKSRIWRVGPLTVWVND